MSLRASSVTPTLGARCACRLLPAGYKQKSRTPRRARLKKREYVALKLLTLRGLPLADFDLDLADDFLTTAASFEEGFAKRFAGELLGVTGDDVGATVEFVADAGFHGVGGGDKRFD